MPIYRQDILFEVARNIKAFLRLEAGVTRGEVPDSQVSGLVQEQLKQAHRQLARKDEQIALLKRESDSDGGRVAEKTVNPENIVWIFGTARTGSTWLASMMEELEGCKMWDEPLIGSLFGSFHYGRAAHKKNENSLFRSTAGRRKRLIRSFVLAAVGERFPGLGEQDYVVIKEPNGSIGAPLLSEALPESRMILLVRDPRDVVSSNLGARGENGWFREAQEKQGRKTAAVSEDPNEIVRSGATKYRNFVSRSKQAYEAHMGRKVVVRYEDLRSDTLGTMKHIYSTLDMPVDERMLALAVEKHSWENISEDRKGPGKRQRKATPGGWREDLTPEQVEIVESITAPLLEEFYTRAGA